MLRKCLLSIIGLAFTWPLLAQTNPKVLFIGKQPDHPYGTHMYLHTCQVLAKCLRLNGDIQTVISNGWPEDQEIIEGVSAIVVYTSPAAEFLLDGPQREQVVNVMARGTGLVTIHWASSIYQRNWERLGPIWLSYLGGTWISNVGLHTGESPIEQLVATHPVCRGWEAYRLHDEFYLNPHIGEATPLLAVTVNGQSVTVGWAYERKDGGRSFATTLGHFYRNFQQEPFRRMVVNAILWTAKVEVPAGGARVDLPDSELALPPAQENKR